MADTYILTDANGIEHEFPASFDPIKAASIVRKNNEKPGMLAKAIDWAVEPSRVGTAIQTRDNQMADLIEGTERTPVHARITDVIKDAPGIVGDIASGLWNNPVATLRGGAAGLMQGVGDTTAGLSSPAGLVTMAAGPLGRVAKAVPALANVVRVGTGLANGAFAGKGAEQVLNAPDAEGKLMGLTQLALGAHGVASDPAVGPAARRTAVKTGEMLTRSADSAAVRNTLRATAVGAAGGAAASGHPGVSGLVAPLVIAPEAMRFAGQKLIKFGTGTSGVVPAAGATGAEPLARPDAGRTAYESPIGETAQEAAARLQADQKGSAPVERGGFDRDMLKKQGYSEEMIDRLAAADAASRRPQGAAKPNLGQGPINLTEPTVVPDTDPRVAAPRTQPLDNVNTLDALQGGPEFIEGAAQTAARPYHAGDVLGQEGSQRFMENAGAQAKPVVDELARSYDDPLTQGLTPAERAKFVGDQVRRASGDYFPGGLRNPRNMSPFERQVAELERGNPEFSFEGSGPLEGGVDAGPSIGELPKQPRLLEASGVEPPKQLGGGEYGSRLQLPEGTPIRQLPASSLEAQMLEFGRSLEPSPQKQLTGQGEVKQLTAGNPDAHALPPSSMEEQMLAAEQETPVSESEMDFPPVPEPAPAAAAAAEPAPAEPEAPSRFTRVQEEKTAMDDAVQQYKAAYPDADEATVRRGLSDLMDHARSEAGEAAETSGQALLKEIAKAGGLSIKNETGLKGEIGRLKEFRDLQTRKVNGPASSAQTTNGVRGVFNDANGLPADSVLEALTRNGDPRWSHIKTLDDLTNAIQAAATETPASRTAHIDAFKQMVQNELPKSDTLDTGETQGRLPGDVGAVRDTENPTPREEAPFSLAAESGPAKGFEQQSLATEAATSDPAEVLKSQGLDPHEKVAIEESGVTPSKSRRSKNQMSATPGLTKSDMTAAGLNPDLKLTKITRLQARLMMDARAARHAKYYAGAKTAAAEAAAADAE